VRRGTSGFGLLARLARAKYPPGREGDIQAALAVARGVASRAYPFDEDAAREWIEREADHGPRDAQAQARQAGAPWHGRQLRDLKRPTLVLHGDQDPILRPSAARATARAIEDARLVILPAWATTCPRRCGPPSPAKSAPWPIRPPLGPGDRAGGPRTAGSALAGRVGWAGSLSGHCRHRWGCFALWAAFRRIRLTRVLTSGWAGGRLGRVGPV
jgi:hypothetical protein